MRIVFALLLAASAAFAAADSCSNWMPQPDGTKWRTCVDSKGNQYCEQQSKDGNISRVSCK
jgi:hypothetical protein